MAISEKRKDIFTYIVVGLFIFGGVLLGLSTRFSLTFNTSPSLPYHLFITNKMEHPKERGTFVKFMLPDTRFFERKHWTKRIVGTPGDVVTVRGRKVFINGEFVGEAKRKSLKGRDLTPITPIVIPQGYYYVQADHIDSFDSRYKSLGLIHENVFIGRDYPVF